MVSYEEWISAVFDHPPDGPEWFWGPEFDAVWGSLEISDSQTISFLTRLFGNPSPARSYSLEQVGQAIWFLIGDSSPAAIAHMLLSSDTPLERRIACINAMAVFFRDFVDPSAPGAAEEDSNPFHVACYMWWDIFPSWGGSQAGEPALHAACLDTMADILQLPSELCQLSALHGLNHWRLHYASRVEQIIDTFLFESGQLTPRIRDYATAARSGCCL